MKKGFTLVELLASITLIAVLTMVTLPYILKKMDAMKEKQLESLVSTIQESTKKYVVDNREDLSEFEEKGFINIPISILIDEEYIEGNLENAITGEKIAVDDVIYVTIDSKNVIKAIYDPNQKDNPKITLNGNKNLRLKLGSTYVERGAIAVDKNGNNISAQITITSNVNMLVEGEYIVSYSVPNSIVIERCVTVTNDFISNDIEKPILTSNVSGNYKETTIGVNITMPVVTATDNVDGVISPITPTSNNLNINQTGTYQIKYNYTDAAGNKANTLTITVVVKP